MRVLCLLFSLLVANLSFAHELSSGYLTLKRESDTSFSGAILLKPAELGQAAHLDSNNDGKLTWREVMDNQSGANSYLQQTLTLSQHNDACELQLSKPAMDSISAQAMLRYPVTIHCSQSGLLSIDYQGIFALIPSHKLLVTFSDNGQQRATVLDADSRTFVQHEAGQSALSLFGEFVYQGVLHIWIGIDHILFLVATLLTVALFRKNGKWIAEPKLRVVIKNAFYLITAFTLAHSVTLTTTALGFITPSSRWVEIGIALSVLFTAINNIFPLILRLGIITFLFGLLHGMGFASVFSDLNTQSDSLVLSVAAFNIGVEIGQLAIVAVVMPVLVLLRHKHIYTRVIMPLSSSIIALIALNWAIQRW